MTEMTVALFPREIEALARISADECRAPTEQLVYLLRQEAIRRGILPDPARPYITPPQSTATH